MSKFYLVNSVTVANKKHYAGELVDTDTHEGQAVKAAGGQLWPANDVAVAAIAERALFARVNRGAHDSELEKMMQAAVDAAMPGLPPFSPEDEGKVLVASKAPATYALRALGAGAGGEVVVAAPPAPVDALSAEDRAKLASITADAVTGLRAVGAGPGLAGGGTLEQDIAFKVVLSSDGSLMFGPDGIGIRKLVSGDQHGAHNGGGLHALVSADEAGFISPDSQKKIDALSEVAFLAVDALAAKVRALTPVKLLTAADLQTADAVTVDAALATLEDMIAKLALNTTASIAAVSAETQTALASVAATLSKMQPVFATLPSASGVQVQSTVLNVGTFMSAGAVQTASFPLGDKLPANARFMGAEIVVETGLTGLGFAAGTVTVEAAGEAAGSILGATDALTLGTKATPGSNPYASRGGQQLQATVSVTGVSLAALTAGALTVNVFYALVS